MKAKSALTLALAAGLCGTAMADIQTSDPAVGKEMKVKSAGLIGHIYYKVSTGEMVYTPAAEYLANKAATHGVRASGDDINGDGVADYWVNTNGNPCGFTTPTSGLPNTDIAGIDNPPTSVGDYHMYKYSSRESDLLIDSLQFSWWTDMVDTDTNPADGSPDGNTAGLGMEITFWDGEDGFGQTSSNCTIAGGPGWNRTGVVAYQFTNLPGPLTAPPAGFVNGFILTFDLDGGSEMELLDSDGSGPTSGFFNPFITADGNSDTVSDADSDGDTRYDVGISLHGIQPSTGSAVVAYQLSAPGVSGDNYQLNWDLVNPVADGDNIPNAGNRLDAGGATGLSYDMTRIDAGLYDLGTGAPTTPSSVPAPLAEPMFVSIADIDNNVNTNNFSYIGRFSLYFGSTGESPYPDAGLSDVGCGGTPASDYYAWGGTSDIDGNFYGGLNCVLDDAAGPGRPFAGVWIALGGTLPSACICDIDGNSTLNLDDINLFAAAFTAGDLAADMDGNSTLNLDDINLFAACFTAGCP